jgi:hypothetical protein
MKYEKHHTTSLIVREKLWAVSIAAFIIMLSVFYITATQQKASGFTTTTQSLSYNNPEQKISIDYPPDWGPPDEKNGPEKYAPERLFSVSFSSPSNKDGADFVTAYFDIDRLDSPTTTLQEHEKKQVDTLSGGYTGDFKNVVASSITLGGNPAYRLDYMEKFLDFKKVIEVDTLKDGKLYKLWFVGDSDTMDKYSDVVQKIIESVKIG